jgi:hypothetical protein
MYETGRSLAFDGDLSLEPSSLPQMVPGQDGAYVSKYDPGLPLFTVPIIKYADDLAASHQANRYATAALFVMVIPAAAMSLANAGLYLLATRLYAQKSALMVTLVAALATIVFPYARLFFPESILTACLVLALWAVWTGHVWVASFALGVGIVTRAGFAIYMPVFVWLVWMTMPRWNIGLLVMFPLLAAAGLLYHNYLRFGTIWETGYEGEGGFTGLGWLGLLFSPGKSIFIYSPPLILGAVLWYRFRQRFRVLADSMLLMFVVGIGFYGAWWAWHGGWVWGPRLLVPLVPLWCLPFGVMPIRRQWILAASLIITVGVAVQIIGTFTNVVPHYSEVFQNAHPDSPARYEEIHWHDPPLMAGVERAAEGRWEPSSVFHLEDLGLPPHWQNRTPIAIAILGTSGIVLIGVSRWE